VDELPTDNEQIYKDSGHKKEKIYEWFEKKKFRKLESDDIKYIYVGKLAEDSPYFHK